MTFIKLFIDAQLKMEKTESLFLLSNIVTERKHACLQMYTKVKLLRRAEAQDASTF